LGNQRIRYLATTISFILYLPIKPGEEFSATDEQDCTDSIRGPMLLIRTIRVIRSSAVMAPPPDPAIRAIRGWLNPVSPGSPRRATADPSDPAFLCFLFSCWLLIRRAKPSIHIPTLPSVSIDPDLLESRDPGLPVRLLRPPFCAFCGFCGWLPTPVSRCFPRRQINAKVFHSMENFSRSFPRYGKLLDIFHAMETDWENPAIGAATGFRQPFP
jgi:hypothetical protein